MKALIQMLGNMSLEELLETYRNAEDFQNIAEASLLRLLVTMELDKRING